MTINPHLLPKIRSEALMQSATMFPACTLKLGSFVGIPCAPSSTFVMCHLPTIGKGMSTKVSDLFTACGCATCHDILDGRHSTGHDIRWMYSAAFAEQIMRAHHETMSRWVGMGLLIVPDMDVI